LQVVDPAPIFVQMPAGIAAPLENDVTQLAVAPQVLILFVSKYGFDEAPT
jgi:hypothetical protein